MSVKEITSKHQGFQGFPDERVWELGDSKTDQVVEVFASEDERSMKAIDWALRKADALDYFDYQALMKEHNGRQTDWIGVFKGDCLSDKGMKAKWPLLLSVVVDYDNEVDKLKALLDKFDPKLKVEFENWLESSR